VFYEKGTALGREIWEVVMVEKRGGSEQYEHINEGRCCVD